MLLLHRLFFFGLQKKQKHTVYLWVRLKSFTLSGIIKAEEAGSAVAEHKTHL